MRRLAFVALVSCDLSACAGKGLPLASFDGIDGRDLMGVFLGTSEPGRFALEIDDVSFAP